MTLLHVLSVVVGVVLAVGIIGPALQTVVLPRRGFTRMTRFVFAVVHRILVHRRGKASNRELLRSLFAPVSLVSLPLVWMLLSTVAFTFVFWGVGGSSFSQAFTHSGSSLFTLGFSEPTGVGRIWLTFIEATIGLGLVALLIGYLPTIYTAYNEREKGIHVLRPFAGSPPTAARLMEYLLRANLLAAPTVWTQVSNWFIDLEQSHTSFPALSYFPTQVEGQSWVASFGTALDRAALLLATSGLFDLQRSSGPTMALAYGIPALGRIGRAASIPVVSVPILADLTGRWDEAPPAISIQRDEFDRVCGGLVTREVVAAGRPHLIGQHPLKVIW